LPGRLLDGLRLVLELLVQLARLLRVEITAVPGDAGGQPGAALGRESHPLAVLDQ
jgi:hypothetical protein